MNKPSVSNLLFLLNKPGLIEWSNKIGLKGISLKDYRNKSMKKGNDYHYQISRFINSGKEIENIKLKQKILKSGIKFISSEEKVETKYFIGRLDARCLIKNEKFIVDFKSSDNVYFENKLQLCCYKMAYPDHKTAIITLPDFKIKHVEFDYENYSNIIKCLNYIYKSK